MKGRQDEAGSVVSGFFIAAIIPAAFISVFTPAAEPWSFRAILGFFLLTYPFSAAATWAFGLPTFLILRPFRPGHWWSVAIVGFFLGFLVALTMRLPDLPNFHDILVFGALATLSSLTFWIYWKRTLPK